MISEKGCALEPSGDSLMNEGEVSNKKTRRKWEITY